MEQLEFEGDDLFQLKRFTEALNKYEQVLTLYDRECWTNNELKERILNKISKINVIESGFWYKIKKYINQKCKLFILIFEICSSLFMFLIALLQLFLQEFIGIVGYLLYGIVFVMVIIIVILYLHIKALIRDYKQNIIN